MKFVIYFVLVQCVFKCWQVGIVINYCDFNVVYFGELVYIVEVQCMVEDGMVCVISEDLCFGSSWQIWLCFLQCICYWQFWQGVWCFYCVDIVNQQMVMIVEINQVGDNCWIGLGIEDQLGRIVFIINIEMLNVEDWFFFYGN